MNRISNFCFLVLITLVGFVFISIQGCNKDDNNTTQRIITVRKNVKDLTPQEKLDFVNAVKLLKATPSPYDTNLNYYDQFVYWHYRAFYCHGNGSMGGMYPAHQNPAFLPWHRSYLSLFENALREVSGKPISIPYWDWTDSASTAALFSDDMLGGNGDPAQGYEVTTGPFRQGQWTIRISDDINIDSLINYGVIGTNPHPNLMRAFGIFKTETVQLPTAPEVEFALGVNKYDSYPWDVTVDTNMSFRNTLEGWRGCAGNDCINSQMDVIPIPGLRRSTMHNVVHIWVGGVFPDGASFRGGSMAQNTSPNDPTFWIHHANIDRLWSAWMARHEHSYLPVAGGPMGSNLYDVMEPFSFRADGFNTPYSVLIETKMGYRYESLQ
jgi:tyrosinase